MFSHASTALPFRNEYWQLGTENFKKFYTLWTGSQSAMADTGTGTTGIMS